MWKPIEDLPQDWRSLTDGELSPLLTYWNDQRAELDREGILRTFLERLSREWAIETGQIEGVYDLDRGITQSLIERGINADLIHRVPGQRLPEMIAAIIQDHADVLEGLFQFVKGDRPLSRSYISELHAALLRHQDTATARDQFGNLFEAGLVRGAYKQRPNNPTRPDGTLHEYCPPEHTEAEMDRLIAMHAAHTGVPVEVESAWLHHRFAQIHPYQDGNGRVARALASIIFLKAGWFPVVVTRDDRERYIDALEVADEGNLRSLVAFFVDVQKRALFQAAQAAADLHPAETIDEAIAAAKNALATPVDDALWRRTHETASHLLQIGAERLREARAALPQLAGVRIESEPAGPRRRGLASVTVSYEGAVVGVSFLVSYVESREDAERRFRPWLERTLAAAITSWRRRL